MNRRPSVAPWPVVPIIVIAESCVAITDSPTTHQGSERFARKYDSISRVPRERRSPMKMMKPIHPTTIAQFSGCTGAQLGGESVLQPPEQQQRHDLNAHDFDERSAESRAIVGRRCGGDGHGTGRLELMPALRRFTKSRAAPGTPAGN